MPMGRLPSWRLVLDGHGPARNDPGVMESTPQSPRESRWMSSMADRITLERHIYRSPPHSLHSGDTLILGPQRVLHFGVEVGS